MHTTATIQIRAQREKIFAIVSDLARWPLLLPHYRQIEFLGKEGNRSLLRLSCRGRGGLPFSWLATYRHDWRRFEMQFEHVSGWTRGLRAKWALMQGSDACRLEIAHELSYHRPALAGLAEPLVARLMVEPVTDRTLRAFQDFFEHPPAPRPEEVLSFDEPEVAR